MSKQLIGRDISYTDLVIALRVVKQFEKQSHPSSQNIATLIMQIEGDLK